MTCDECRELLVLGEEEGAAPVAVREHLAACVACQNFVQEQTALRSEVHKLAESEHAPETLRRQVQEMIESRATGGAHSLRHKMRLAGIAATVVLVTAGYLGTRYYLSQRGPTPDHLTQQFISDHLHFLPGREQIVSDSPQAIQKWFEGRVDFPVRVPQVPIATLEDARVCDIAGRKAALLHYRHKPGETLISLFVTAEPKSFEREKHPVSLVKAYQGYNATLWCQRGLVYSLVASLDDASLKQIEESVKSQVP